MFVGVVVVVVVGGLNTDPAKTIYHQPSDLKKN
jgi:hypothetical protein